MTRHEAIQTALLFICVGLLVALGGEAGARLLHLSPRPIIMLDHCVGYKGIPSIQGVSGGPAGLVPISMNSEGFRDVEHSKEKPPGVYRVLVLGDSYTEALQVPMEDTFWYVLQKKAADAHMKLEVITMAVSSWSTGQELNAYGCFGEHYSPDLVVLVFDTDDLADNAVRMDPFTPTFRMENGMLKLDESYKTNISARLAERKTLYPGLLYTLKDNSELMRYLLFSYANAKAGKSLGSTQGAPVYTEGAWELTEKLLGTLALEIRSVDSKLLILNIPMLHAVSVKRLQSFATENHASFIDTAPILHDAERAQPVHWQGDPHLTAYGHSVVAELLFGTITPWIQSAGQKSR